ncbi:MAG: transglutaminase-like domain-containing protein [Candidatus Thermoplasmatota archaeon]
MRTRATLACLLILVPLLSGCADLFGRGLADHRVARTPIETTGWNIDGLFSVQVREAGIVQVEIDATATDGRALHAEGPSSETLPAIELAIPDGTWTIRYFLDGTKWETFKGARFDSTAPAVTGLQTLGDAQDGRYTIGAGATVESGATIRVINQGSGLVVATTLPTQVTSLANGIHTYDVVFTDAAGNQLVEQVQVRSGTAIGLPAGQHTLGLVARYTLTAELWDISDLASWITPEQARSAVANDWLGSGRGITPDDPAVEAVVASETTPEQSSGEAAFALFRWMADNLEYDRSRLDSTTLLLPRQTLLDSEDPADNLATGDPDGDGFARDGNGNGVRGGVCRDLAGLYVSLLRSAGIPARLVTGYLGGEVDGFHAWVEFYGGDGHGPSPWVPVDVSAITGPYSAPVALQAFGLRHTDMMPLRVVTEAQEEDTWSTAVGMSTRYPESRQPNVDLAKTLTPQFEVRGTLCFHTTTLARLIIPQRNTDDCPHAYTHGFSDFVRSASQVLDYGATVEQAAAGTTVTLTLAYPDAAAVAPGTVEQATYCGPAANCASFEKDAAAGVTVGEWSS